MNDIKEIVEGFNAGYILQQKRPDTFKLLEQALNDVEVPFFDAFTKGGKEYTQERIKSLMMDKGLDTPSQNTPSKDELDIDLDV